MHTSVTYATIMKGNEIIRWGLFYELTSRYMYRACN